MYVCIYIYVCINIKHTHTHTHEYSSGTRWGGETHTHTHTHNTTLFVPFEFVAAQIVTMPIVMYGNFIQFNLLVCCLALLNVFHYTEVIFLPVLTSF